MAVAGHYGAAHAAFRILEAGGNAIDAGVAGGIALGVLQSDIVNVAGVAPTLVYVAARDEVVSIAGLGTWPKAASAEFFRRNHDGLIPPGLLRTVVPAAPAAWIAALERFGTMSFGDVAAAAIWFRPRRLRHVSAHGRDREKPRGRVSQVAIERGNLSAEWSATCRVGELFVQSDLARTLQFMADEERKAAGKGRAAGLAAARDAFYRGDIAATIVRFHRENGGWLSAEDMATFDAEIERPVRIRYKGYDVFTCQPWCQGPAVAQALKLVEGIDLRAIGHNTSSLRAHHRRSSEAGVRRP